MRLRQAALNGNTKLSSLLSATALSEVQFCDSRPPACGSFPESPENHRVIALWRSNAVVQPPEMQDRAGSSALAVLPWPGFDQAQFKFIVKWHGKREENL